MKKMVIVWVALMALACQSPKEFSFSEEDINLVPKPQEMHLSKGHFEFTEETIFVAPDSLKVAFQILTEKFKTASGWGYIKNIQRNNPKNLASVTLLVDKNLLPEQYHLISKKEGISITASDYQGFVYGLQTIKQLLPKEIESQKVVKTDWVIPALEIIDKPQYKWRGLMLDVSRHFFEKEYVLKTIERMSALKINKLHLHLMDNEGWRIEIKKYPKLTEVGGWRVNQEDKHWNARTMNDPNEKGTYGGFFTQEDIKEIVAYAQIHGIEVIPEVEMPAHTMSAIAAYPELSCHKRQIAVPSGGVWPITDIYCAGQEETFTFLENVLEEVISLFPTKYIHIGGDEATHTEWEKCPKCKETMQKNGLKNAHELQSFFIKRINKFLQSKNKQLIGWDEIVEGGLPENAIVMVWRGNGIVTKAAEQGSQVILTSQGYIDQYQGLPDNEPLAIGGYLPMSRIYKEAFEENKLTEKEKEKVLGVQANLWAEYIPNEKHSEYMLFPRLLALSEVFWTPEKDRNWEDFMKRAQVFFPRFELQGINYAKSIYQVKPTIENKEDKAILSLESEFPNADIRYWLNETDISQAEKYNQSIEIDKTTIYNTAVFIDNKPFKIHTDTITFHKAVGKQVSYQPTYHKRYQGQGDKTLTNIVRGTKNFHDKQWLGWLVTSPEIVLDLEKETEISRVELGAMENQGSGIYFPTKITLLCSSDGKKYEKIGEINRPYAVNGYILLKDFSFEFAKKSARFIKIEVQNLGHPPKGGDAWLFIDEVRVF